MRKVLLIAATALALSACGPKAEKGPAAPKLSPARSARVLPTAPVLSGAGTVASLEGSTLVLDHDAVPGGLPAGRHAFEADAAVLATAPIEAGARVAFSYQDWKPNPLLTELKAR